MSQQEQKGQQESKEKEHLKLQDQFNDQKALKSIVSSFLSYDANSLKQVARVERDTNNSKNKRPEFQKLLKYSFDDKTARLKECVKVNQEFLDKVVNDQLHLFQFTESPEGKKQLAEELNISRSEVLRMRSAIKQLAREWSEEGKPQRDQSYAMVLAELEKYFPNPKIEVEASNGQKQYRRVKVLNPGAAYGRLPYECAKRGYVSQGNQYSYLNLLGAKFLVNSTQHAKQFTIYPYIHNFSNNRKYENLFRQVKIPDECPSSELPKDGDFSMVSGDFVMNYKDQKEEWDCLITSFFIDTAKNIFEYFTVIHDTLKKGGVWINFGPLLYEITEFQEDCSVFELSWEEVRFAVQKIGFQIKRESFQTGHYSAEIDSMMRTTYTSIFFTAIKK